MILFLLATFSRHFLIERSDILQGEEMRVAAKAYLNMSSFCRTVRSSNIRRISTGHSSAQSSLLHMAQLLLHYHLDMKLFEKARKSLCTICSEKWLSRLYSFDANALLAQNFPTFGMAKKPLPMKVSGLGWGALLHKRMAMVNQCDSAFTEIIITEVLSKYSSSSLIKWPSRYHEISAVQSSTFTRWVRESMV